MNVLKDVLHMTKSLCVARHFHKMDKVGELLGYSVEKHQLCLEQFNKFHLVTGGAHSWLESETVHRRLACRLAKACGNWLGLG